MVVKLSGIPMVCAMRMRCLWLLMLGILSAGCGDAFSTKAGVVGSVAKFDYVDQSDSTKSKAIPSERDDKTKRDEDPNGLDGKLGQPQPDDRKPLEVKWPDTPQSYMESVKSLSLFTPLFYEEGSKEKVFGRDFGDQSKRPGGDNGVLEMNRALDALFEKATGEPNMPRVVASDRLRNYWKQIGVNWLIDHRLDTFKNSVMPTQPFVVTLLQSQKGYDKEASIVGKVDAGRVTYQVLASSFVRDRKTERFTGEPKWVLNPVVLKDKTRLEGYLKEMRLPVAVGPVVVSVLVKDVKVEANIVLRRLDETGDIGVDYQNGLISGVVLLEDLFSALNRAVAQECSCKALDSAPLYSLSEQNGWHAQCDQKEYSSCTREKAPIWCETFLFSQEVSRHGYCGETFQVLQNSADIRSKLQEKEPKEEGERGWNALSLGYQFTASAIK